MELICIKECNSVYLNVTHNYIVGDTYKYNYKFPNTNNYLLNNIKKPEHTVNFVVGYVPLSFVDKHFILKRNYNQTLNEVDNLFDSILTNDPQKLLQKRIDQFYRNI